jgi:hypothetical protein
VLDASDLEFIDVHGLRELDRYAADSGATLVLGSAPSFVPKMIGLLDLHAVRLEPPP